MPNANVKSKSFYSLESQLEGGALKNKLQKFFEGSQTVWNNFLKPAVNVAAHLFGLVVEAKTESPQVAQATSNFLKSTSGGKVLSLTDMHSHAVCV